MPIPQINENNDIDFPESSIHEKDNKASSSKFEPFGDLTNIIKKNILSQAKKTVNTNRQTHKTLNINLNLEQNEKNNIAANKIKNDENLKKSKILLN